jgi:hypothetical protein
MLGEAGTICNSINLCSVMKIYNIPTLDCWTFVVIIGVDDSASFCPYMSAQSFATSTNKT